MDGEVSDLIKIPISLIMLIVVYGTIFTSLGVVRGTFSSYSTTLENAVNHAYESELVNLGFYSKPIPAASVYAIAQKNSSLVIKVYGSAKNRDGDTVTVNNVNDLQNLFDSKVLVTVKHDTDGMYTIYVESSS